MHPRLHLLGSYLLILPSVSIRPDCCHFRPVCPCISFSAPLSPAHSSLCLSQSISLLKTDRQHNNDTSRGWSSGVEWGVCTAKAFCEPAISKKDHRQYYWTSVRLQISLFQTYWTLNTFLLKVSWLREKSFFWVCAHSCLVMSNQPEISTVWVYYHWFWY